MEIIDACFYFGLLWLLLVGIGIGRCIGGVIPIDLTCIFGCTLVLYSTLTELDGYSTRWNK